VLTGAERTQVVASAPAAVDTMLHRPPESDRRRHGMWYALLAVAVIGLFVLAAFLTKSLTGGPSTFVVPNEIGNTLATAKDDLTQNHFRSATKTAISSAADKGKVIAQSPRVGTRLAQNKTVTLTVGAGPEQVTVPSLVGLNRDVASNKLGGARLQSKVVEVPSDRPAGEVVSTIPVAGTAVPVNSFVTINYSDGSVKVPNVIGQTEDQATNTLTGFSVRTVDRPSAQPAGTVIDQSPTGGTLKQKGSTVIIYVARPLPQPTPSESPSPSPSPSTPPPLL
jgi:beta-lactam-binding protein with PASTA domain